MSSTRKRLQSDSYGRTALHHACLNCNVAMTKALLANGANAEAKDNDGNTPWDYAKNPNSETLTRKTHFRIVFASQYLKEKPENEAKNKGN